MRPGRETCGRGGERKGRRAVLTQGREGGWERVGKRLARGVPAGEGGGGVGGKWEG